jgi:signal recognition particle subunit SRP54
MPGGMPDVDPVELERMAREMGMDPAALQQGAAESAPAKELPRDVNQLLKSGGKSLPGLGAAPQFPGLPGLGSGPIRKK